eukprot:scaffold383309_cov45-Prasinocladus_malaysianus.AAC.1
MSGSIPSSFRPSRSKYVIRDRLHCFSSMRLINARREASESGGSMALMVSSAMRMWALAVLSLSSVLASM